MQKLILVNLVLLITIISCNNQDQSKNTAPATGEFISAREKILKDSMAVFPQSVLLKEELIQLYRDSAEYGKAIAAVDQVLQGDSLNDRFWDIKGTLHFENEDTLHAIRSFETAWRLNPSPRYLILLGSLYAQTKNARAIAVADALLRSGLPDTEKEAFFIKGLYYNFSGDKNKALSMLDQCLNIDSRHMLAYREKAIALYDLGRYNDAVTVLDKAVTLNNSFDEGYYWLGRCLEKLNKPADAMEEYKTALLYAPDYAEAKEALQRLQPK